MSEITVSFLGERYTFPQELQEYVVYKNDFEKIDNRLVNVLSNIMKIPSIYEGENTQVDGLEITLDNKLRQEGKEIISLLSKKGIFDVTESDLIDNNKGYILYKKIYQNLLVDLMKGRLEETGKYIESVQNIKKEVYSQITGSGMTLYSNSALAHMTFAALETSKIKKQCQKADRNYDLAIANLQRRNNSERERREIAIAKQAYNDIFESLHIFVSELMKKYLSKLKEYDIYDYTKVMPYDIIRSTEILNNINIVENKEKVLKQAFKNCPYNPYIYEEVLEYNLCDIDTFLTAKFFYQDDLLKETIFNYCRENLHDLEKIKNPVKVLAIYENTTENKIYKTVYQDMLNEIIPKATNLKKMFEDENEIYGWLCRNVSYEAKDVVEASPEKIKEKLFIEIDNVISETDYNNCEKMGWVDIDTFRLQGSAANTLDEVKAELKEKLFGKIEVFRQKLSEEEKEKQKEREAQREREEEQNRIEQEKKRKNTNKKVVLIGIIVAIIAVIVILGENSLNQDYKLLQQSDKDEMERIVYTLLEDAGADWEVSITQNETTGQLQVTILVTTLATKFDFNQISDSEYDNLRQDLYKMAESICDVLEDSYSEYNILVYSEVHSTSDGEVLLNVGSDGTTYDTVRN